MIWSGVRRLLAAAAVAVLLGTAVGVGPASAHGSLVRSDPPDGGVVAVGRTEASLWFDEPVDLASARFVLRTGEGAPLRATASATGRSTYVQLSTDPMRRGVLVLSWTVTSAVDGHVSTGSITFGAGVRPDPAASAATAPSAPEVATRWLLLASVVVAVGAMVAAGLTRPAAAYAPDAPRRALRLGALAALVGLLTSLADTAGIVDSLRTDRWAQLWAVRGLALAVAVVALAGLARRGPSRHTQVTAGCALVVAAVADAASGHAAGLPRASVAAVVATSVHVLAAGVWLGTLVVLAVCLLPTMRRHPEARRPLLRTAWRPFGPVAAVAATLVVASGLYLAGRHLPDLSAVASGWYGLALAGKTLLLGVALGTALLATLTVGRRIPVPGVARWLPSAPDPARFPRVVLTELAVLTGAVLLAAVMTTVPTTRATTVADRAPGAGTGVTVDGLFVTFEAVPVGSAETRLVVHVNAVTRPQPGPVTGADVLLVTDGREVSVPLREVEPGHFEGGTPSPASGGRQTWVSVHRSGVADAVARVTWDPAPAPAGASGLEQVTTVLAALLGLGALVAAGVAAGVVVRRRRAVDASDDPARALAPVGGRRGEG